jgi:hypothetical protein
MTTEQLSDYILEFYPDEEIKLYDEYISAFIGFGRQKGGSLCAVYDRDLCLESLASNNDWDYEAAEEWFGYNSEDAYYGPNTPIFVETMEIMDGAMTIEGG